jgi:hypothetical protein
MFQADSKHKEIHVQSRKNGSRYPIQFLTQSLGGHIGQFRTSVVTLLNSHIVFAYGLPHSSVKQVTVILYFGYASSYGLNPAFCSWKAVAITCPVDGCTLNFG